MLSHLDELEAPGYVASDAQYLSCYGQALKRHCFLVCGKVAASFLKPDLASQKTHRL